MTGDASSGAQGASDTVLGGEGCPVGTAAEAFAVDEQAMPAAGEMELEAGEGKVREVLEVDADSSGEASM